MGVVFGEAARAFGGCWVKFLGKKKYKIMKMFICRCALWLVKKLLGMGVRDQGGKDLTDLTDLPDLSDLKKGMLKAGDLKEAKGMTPKEWAERILAEERERPVTAVMYGGALDGHECEGVVVSSACLLIMKDFSTGVSYAYERMDCWKDGKAMYRFSMVVGRRVESGVRGQGSGDRDQGEGDRDQ